MSGHPEIPAITGETEALPKKAAANTKAAFGELVGGTVIGILRDALPVNRHDLSRGNTTLVMHDGSGFTFADNGSYWRESQADVERAIGQMKQALEEAQGTYEAVLALAGGVPTSGRTTTGEK